MKAYKLTHAPRMVSAGRVSARWISMASMAAMLFAITLTGLGCSKQDGAVPVGTGRDARAVGTAGVAIAGAGISLNGWVIAPGGEQSLFQESVGGLISATVPESSLGYVSSSASGGTGVFLGGKVELQSGVYNSGSSANSTIRTDSKLMVAVYDEFVGRPDPQTGKPVPAFVLAFAKAEGSVQGTHAVLKFIDDTYGWIQLDGYISGTTFQGEFKYWNYVLYDGTKPGYNGTLGQFQIPACQFFRCQ